MITKCFEVRDCMTFIPVCAMSTEPANDGQRYLLRRAGYSRDGSIVIVVNLNDCKSANEPHGWRGRTMPVAHLYIEQHFAELEDGAVIDVEHILGDRVEPKESERIESDRVE